MPSAKFDVEMSSFKSGISAAKNEVKTLDQQMKMLDATMKAEGKSEQTLSQQAETLNKRMAAQKNIAKNAESALKAMTNEAIDPASDAYQRMSRELLAAQTGMMETQAALNQLGQGAEQAAGGVEQLENGLNGISKKISLEQVRSGIDTISKGLENAAKKAVNLGKAIWENITDVARFSDDTATQAMILNMNVEDYQAYKNVFDTVGEITVQEWQKAKQKVQKVINDPTQEQVDLMKMLGINTHDIVQGKNGEVQGAARDFEEVFWQIGETLKKKVDSGEMTQDLADTYANALFGKGFAQLNPMFDLGQEGFLKAVNTQKVASEEAIKKNAELNDKLIQLQNDFNSLKTEALSGLAPALTGAADALDGLLTSVLDYLQKPEGQKALEDLGTAVSGLFSDLGKIDPEAVVEGFTSVFNTVVDSVQWVVDNSDEVVAAMEAILGGWALLQVTGGVLDIIKVVTGLQDLLGAEAAGTAAGAAWGKGFGAAVMKAAPILAFLYTLLNPSGTSDKLGDTGIIDEKGNLTTEAGKYNYKQDENGDIYQDQTQLVNEAAQKAWDLYRSNQLTQDGMDELRRVVLNDEKFDSLMNEFMDFRKKNGENWKEVADIDLTEWLKGLEEPPKVPVDPEMPANAAEQIAEQIGTVTVHVEPVVDDGSGYTKRTPRRNGIPGHANGIWAVPTDNYLAILHKDEVVKPARAVNSRNFTSNMYIENMTMNNGQDADGLAARVAAENRRIMSGYGSN